MTQHTPETCDACRRAVEWAAQDRERAAGDDGKCICGRQARRDPHSCAHELKAEVDGLREELALRDDSLANRRVRELEDEAGRLRLALGRIATRIPPPESNEEANWRWAVARFALSDRPIPPRYARFLG